MGYFFISPDGKARELKDIYYGVDGKAKKVESAYFSINNKAVKIYGNRIAICGVPKYYYNFYLCYFRNNKTTSNKVNDSSSKYLIYSNSNLNAAARQRIIYTKADKILIPDSARTPIFDDSTSNFLEHNIEKFIKNQNSNNYENFYGTGNNSRIYGNLSKIKLDSENLTNIYRIFYHYGGKLNVWSDTTLTGTFSIKRENTAKFNHSEIFTNQNIPFANFEGIFSKLGVPGSASTYYVAREIISDSILNSISLTASANEFNNCFINTNVNYFLLNINSTECHNILKKVNTFQDFNFYLTRYNTSIYFNIEYMFTDLFITKGNIYINYFVNSQGCSSWLDVNVFDRLNIYTYESLTSETLRSQIIANGNYITDWVSISDQPGCYYSPTGKIYIYNYIPRA